MSELKQQVRNIIIESFGLSLDDLPSDFDSDSVPEWDSIGHMQLILKLEESLSCEIPRAKIAFLTSEQAIIEELLKHGN